MIKYSKYDPSSSTSLGNDVEMLSMLVESSNEILILMDSSLRVLSFNSKAKQMAKLMLKEPLELGKSLLECSFDDRKEQGKLIYNKVLSNEEVSYNYSVDTPSGRETYTLKFKPITDSKGNVFRIVLSGTNVSKELQAVNNIIATKELLQHSEAIAKIGSWEWDIKTGTILFSDEFYRICGMEPGEVPATKENGFAVIHPDDREMAEKILENSFKTGQPYSINLRLITKNGEKKYVHSRGIIIRDHTGWNEKFIGSFHDVTEVKTLEKSIKRATLRYRYLVEHSTDVLLLVNDNREVSFASPSIFTMMGYKPGELIGVRLRELAAEIDLPVLLQEFQTILATPGVPFHLEYRVKTKTGKLIWVEGTITNLLHVNGIKSVVINQRDISQRKETEIVLKELNETLARNAKELAGSNKELEKFAYIASHDLQEPLRMVKSFLGLLESKYKDQLDEKALQYIHFAVNGGERMEKLINALLEYSRLGTKKLKYENLDMNEKFRNVLHLFNKKITETGAKITADKLPFIYADKIQVAQLLQNLIGNALKYSGEQPPFITIESTEEEGQWIFCLADNGIGIDEKNKDRIFEVFQRLHSRTDYEGTGIGLAICKRIVETHGGKIWFEPNHPTGTRFYFSIKKQNPGVV